MTTYNPDYATDMHTLAALHDAIAVYEPVRYLEVGSESGRSLVPFLRSISCQSVLSIDPRPEVTKDARGFDVRYGVSTDDMLKNLAGTCTEQQLMKLKTFDMDTSVFQLESRSLLPDEIPNMVFIDGEHTVTAVFKDFVNLSDLLPPDSIVAFHDSNLVFDGLTNIETMLIHQRKRFYSAYLHDLVYVLAFGKYIRPVTKLPKWDRKDYIAHARQVVYDEIVANAPHRKRV